MLPEVGPEIEQRLVSRLILIERDEVIGQKGAVRVGQPPAPVVGVFKLGNLQPECHRRLQNNNPNTCVISLFKTTLHKLPHDQVRCRAKLIERRSMV